MRAAVLWADRDGVDVEELRIDKPVGREVLVRVVASGICHSDLHFVDGTWQGMRPIVMGHEGAGIVEAVGPDVTSVAPGDHVIACVSVFCGSCARCLTGHPYLCENASTTSNRAAGSPSRLTCNGEHINQFAGLSTFAEEMLVHEHALVRIREDMPLDRAALIGCGVTTGTGAVFRSARVEPGASVAVIGCGGVGISAVQGARIAGAGRIIAVDLEQRKLDWAAQMGATDTVLASDGDPVEAVKELTGGRGVDYSFEAIGLKVTAEQAYGMIARGGLATVMGMIPPGTRLEIDGADLFMNAKRLQGSLMGSNAFRFDMPKYVDFYLDGRLRLDEMISSRIPLDDINAAFDHMRKGEVARQVIVFD